jgi:hypothetical protein
VIITTRDDTKGVKELCRVQFCSPVLCLMDEIKCFSTGCYDVMTE